MHFRLSLLLAVIFLNVSVADDIPYQRQARSTIGAKVLNEIEWGIQAQRAAGHRSYSPVHVFVVDTKKQRLYVLDRKRGSVVVNIACGTGKLGLGFEDGQTPTGFFTMGGVRIAKDGNASIQTGDTKKGVSGFYAEILFPPSYPQAERRGRVPNGVVMHSYNPNVSTMLRERRSKRLIGRVPCTTGCPVPEIEDVKTLIPYLKASAGAFDPDARPNAALRRLIREGQVKQYANKQLGAAIFIMGPPTQPR